ncbi:MAG: hypothetical protein LBD61_05595 [Endomicrobium sp.]|jgi:hypothetical protein|nr:hypothetical protein [Endomicrobium sp.]
MEIIKLTSDVPSYLKLREIKNELLDFIVILNDKYSSIDFSFWFCFRALTDNAIESGWKSKVTFYKKHNALSFDIIMSEIEFIPYKKDMATQRKIMGKYFYPFFKESIIKYAKKLPSLKPIAENLILDMEKFLTEKEWLSPAE